MSPEEENGFKNEIVNNKGLFQQLKELTKPFPYTLGSFSLDGIKEVMDEMQLSQWREKLHTQLLQLLAKVDSSILTADEYTRLGEMIDSDDQETIYIAEQIIIQKAHGIQGT